MKRLSWRVILRVVVAINVLGATALATRHVQASKELSQQTVKQILLWQADLAGSASPLPAAPTLAGTNTAFRSYSKQLKSNLDKMHKIVTPKPVSGPAVWWSSERSYNAIITGNGFPQAFNRAQVADQDARTAIQHEAAVIEALRHLLDYPAATDLASDDTTVLTPQAQEAVDGMSSAATAIAKLGANGDPTLADVPGQIKQVVGAYKALLASMGTPDQAAAKTKAVAAVQLAQQSIIANRAAYTEAENRRLSAEAAEAATALAPYNKQLAQIQFSQ